MTGEAKTNSLLRRAYAKLNLTLEVIGQEDDGYHQILSVMQAINLADSLYFTPSQSLSLSSNLTGIATTDNLVFKAAKQLGVQGTAIYLKKVIPQGGLGGGSSDAAVTLETLKELWGLKLCQDKLSAIASRLGSDISFFLHHHPTALVEGRGEKVTLLPSPSCSWVILLVPPVDQPQDKTKQMYHRLKTCQFSQGQFTQRLAESLRQGKKVTPKLFYNVFEKIAFESFPGLEQYWQAFLDAGAPSVHLTGAGPVLFTWLEEKSYAEAIYQQLMTSGGETYLAPILTGCPEKQ
jgi:4-diphosphocytidyl-2-C-methyl-D-erythritol kinase